MILGRLPGCAFYESLTCLFTYENDACLLLGNSTVLAAIFFGTIHPIVFRVKYQIFQPIALRYWYV